jgi:membrane-associated phospholipid phosphatase
VRTEGLLPALSVLLLASACATAPAARPDLPPLPAPPLVAAEPVATETLSPPVPETIAGFATLVKNDAAEIATAPLRWDRSDWMKLGLGALAVGGAALLDEEVRKSIDLGSNDTTRSIAKAIEPLGGEYSWGVIGGFFLAGKLLDNDKATAVARDSLASSLIAAGAITPLLKYTIGRRRPSETPETFTLGGGVSFPSGHTTQAFAIASVVASHYDSLWVKVGAYTLAGLVGWSRMETKSHYASDVVAGALIGIVVGKAVVRLHESQRFRISASPSVNRGSAGVALTFGVNLDP